MEEELTSKEENPFFEGFRHGISQNRLGESPHKVILCSLCNKIFWNPQECSHQDCKSAFCGACIAVHLKNEEKCPICHKTPKFEPARFLSIHMLTPLEFRCENSPECQSNSIKYEDLPFHLCDFDKLTCTIEDCTWKGNRKNLENHIDECPLQLILFIKDMGVLMK